MGSGAEGQAESHGTHPGKFGAVALRSPAPVRGNGRGRRGTPRTDTGRGRGVLQHRPAETFVCQVILSTEHVHRGGSRAPKVTPTVELCGGRRPRCRGRGCTTHGRRPPRRLLGLVPGRGMERVRDRVRLLYGTGTGRGRRARCGCRAGRGAKAPLLRCSYAVRHTTHGALSRRCRVEHSRQSPFSSESCTVSSVRHRSVKRSSSERAMARKVGASARFASSVSASSRSHTASRSQDPTVSSTKRHRHFSTCSLAFRGASRQSAYHTAGAGGSTSATLSRFGNTAGNPGVTPGARHGFGRSVHRAAADAPGPRSREVLASLCVHCCSGSSPCSDDYR